MYDEIAVLSALKALQTKIQDLQDEKQSVLLDKRHLEERLAELTERANRHEDDLRAKYTDEIRKMERTIVEMESAHAAQIDSLRGVEERHAQRVADTERQLHADLAKAQQERDTAREELVRVRTELSQSLTEANRLSKNYDDAESSRRQLDTRLGELHATLASEVASSTTKYVVIHTPIILTHLRYEHVVLLC
jgi:chromosome segregation ATPase